MPPGCCRPSRCGTSPRRAGWSGRASSARPSARRCAPPRLSPAPPATRGSGGPWFAPRREALRLSDQQFPAYHYWTDHVPTGRPPGRATRAAGPCGRRSPASPRRTVHNVADQRVQRRRRGSWPRKSEPPSRPGSGSARASAAGWASRRPRVTSDRHPRRPATESVRKFGIKGWAVL